MKVLIKLMNIIVLCYMLIAFRVPLSFSENIDLRITMNGRYGKVVLRPGEPLTLKFQMVPYQTSTANGDLWFLTINNSQLYWYNNRNGWQSGFTPIPMLSGLVSSEPRVLVDALTLPKLEGQLL